MSKNREPLTVEEVLAFADWMSGRQVKETQELLGLSKPTVIKYRKRVQEFVKEEGVDLNQYRLPLYAFYAKIMRTIDYHLTKFDKDTAFRLLEGLGILTRDGSAMKDLADAVTKSKGDNIVQVFSGEKPGKDDGILSRLGSIERALTGGNNRL